MNLMRLMPKIDEILDQVTSEEEGFSGLIDWKTKHDLLSKIHEALVCEADEDYRTSP